MLALLSLLSLVSVCLSGPTTPGPCACPTNNEYSIDTVTTITSPGFGTNVYCPPLTCLYRIFANNGQRVKVNFNFLNIYGQLNIFDGTKGDNQDLLLATLQASVDTSNSIYSSIPRNGNPGVITMVYSGTGGISGSNSGFNLSFTSTSDSGCGQTQLTQSLFGSAINIKSPNYPYNYPPDLSCQWNFTAPSGKLAMISFSSDADTEAGYDVVVISNQDGSNPKAYSGIYGSGANPGNFAPIQEPGQGLLVTFSSDDSVVYRGFNATLNFYTPPNSCDCGQTVYYISDPTQTMTITSPNFGPGHSGYCENANCIYNLIVGNTAYHAKIVFNVFDLEQNYDTLEIDDGINGFQLEKCTGSSCASRTSDNNELTLIFKTDASIGKTGYSATFSATLTN